MVYDLTTITSNKVKRLILDDILVFEQNIEDAFGSDKSYLNTLGLAPITTPPRQELIAELNAIEHELLVAVQLDYYTRLIEMATSLKIKVENNDQLLFDKQNP